jgi:Zn ribbon nucleic-acid-binding protein
MTVEFLHLHFCVHCGAKMDVIDTNVDNKESTNNDSFKNGG